MPLPAAFEAVKRYRLADVVIGTLAYAVLWVWTINLTDTDVTAAGRGPLVVILQLFYLTYLFVYIRAAINSADVRDFERQNWSEALTADDRRRFVKRVRQWCELGHTDASIAGELGITVEELRDAACDSVVPTDAQVERAKQDEPFLMREARYQFGWNVIRSAILIAMTIAGFIQGPKLLAGGPQDDLVVFMVGAIIDLTGLLGASLAGEAIAAYHALATIPDQSSDRARWIFSAREE